MYYLINPLSWPFTIIPNLPPNLLEVIDSPIPLLIGVLGNKNNAKEIDELRNGDYNIIINKNNKLNYYKEEKINFGKESFNNLYFSLLKNYSELKINSNKNVEEENLDFIYEKIYKNIYGNIKNVLVSKIDIAIKKYKSSINRKNNIKSIDTIKTEELELRSKIRDEFINNISDEINSDFFMIFSQTQIFATYLDFYIDNNFV
jgi:hypothetical protein